MITIKTSKLRGLREKARLSALDNLATSAIAPRNGQAKVLTERIAQFETRYEMTSEQMLAGLKAGTVADTADVARWAILLGVRDGRGR